MPSMTEQQALNRAVELIGETALKEILGRLAQAKLASLGGLLLADAAFRHPDPDRFLAAARTFLTSPPMEEPDMEAVEADLLQKIMIAADAWLAVRRSGL